MERKKRTLIHNTYPVILGIDPGYGRVGIAVIKKEDSKDCLVHSECFETSAKLSHPERLLLIGEKVEKIIKKYKPQKIALETLLWSKNVKTAMQVAEARGVILFEATKNNIPICEYNPNQIKLAVTGYGKSDKKQIINMVEKLLKLKPNSSTRSRSSPSDALPSESRTGQARHDDEYDAIATALTCSAIYLSTEKLV